MIIRSEMEADLDGVRTLNLAAFPTPLEADLVDALRGSAAPLISLLAEVESSVIGHILFTPVTIRPEHGEPWTALALGPMAVLPAHQHRGVGSALVRAGLAECRQSGHEVVFVLGHPSYYPRFGFTAGPPRGLTCKWDVPDEVFMVAELTPGALRGRQGRVEYHSLFDAV